MSQKYNVFKLSKALYAIDLHFQWFRMYKKALDIFLLLGSCTSVLCNAAICPLRADGVMGPWRLQILLLGRGVSLNLVKMDTCGG